VLFVSAAGPETLPPAQAGADEIRRGAEEILSRPEFREAPRSLYQRALDALGDLLGDALDALLGGATGSAIAWLVIVLLVGLLAWIVSRGVQADRRRRRVAEAPGVDVEGPRPAVAWDAEADRHEAAGDWRSALRCRYRSLIATLAGAGVVDEVPGRTAGEYRSLVGGTRPNVGEPFGGATDLFERAWYGNEPTGPEEASDFRELAGRVRADAGAR
jgi:hypothetical protein